MFDSLQLARQIQKHGLDDLDHAVKEYEEDMFSRAINHMAAAAQGRLLWDGPYDFLRAMGIGPDGVDETNVAH